MKLELIPLWRWSDGDRAAELKPALFRLLAAIAQGKSLQVAAGEVGVSYRHAWGWLGEWERRFGVPLVALSRGRGARLTLVGEVLLNNERLIRGRLAPMLEEAASELEQKLAEVLGQTADNLRIRASHDFLVARLPYLLRQQKGIALELKFCGSLESLGYLRAGGCDLAGLHIPAGELGRRLWASRLQGGGLKLVQVARRRQGLLVAAGNPKQISGIGDLVRPEVRFVNRQAGSGTRLAFDALLAEAGLSPTQIQGYEEEEFTHSAVAAMVASGAVDVALGLEAAAAQFGLDFVPLFEERYFFALSRHKSAEPAVQGLIQILQGEAFQHLVAALPGYDSAEAGRALRVADLGEIV